MRLIRDLLTSATIAASLWACSSSNSAGESPAATGGSGGTSEGGIGGAGGSSGLGGTGGVAGTGGAAAGQGGNAGKGGNAGTGGVAGTGGAAGTGAAAGTGGTAGAGGGVSCTSASTCTAYDCACLDGTSYTGIKVCDAGFCDDEAAACRLTCWGHDEWVGDAIPGWTCLPSRFNDGTYCNCECGIWDPDCDLPNADVARCPSSLDVCKKNANNEGHCSGPSEQASTGPFTVTQQPPIEWLRRYAAGVPGAILPDSLTVRTAPDVVVSARWVGSISLDGGAPKTTTLTKSLLAGFASADGANTWFDEHGFTQYDKELDSSLPAPLQVSGDGADMIAFGSLDENLLDLGSGPILAGNYLVHLDPARAVSWTTPFFFEEPPNNFRRSARDATFGVAGDHSMFVSGFAYTWDSPLKIGSQTIDLAGFPFLSRFDSTGALLWVKRFDSSYLDELTVASTDAAGNVLVTGWGEDAIKYDGTVIVPDKMGDRMGFAAKIAPDGSLVWVKGGYLYSSFSAPLVTGALASDGGAVLFVEGYYDFGSGPLGADADEFLVRLGPTGALQWSVKVPSMGWHTHVAVRSDGTVIATGIAHQNPSDPPVSFAGKQFNCHWTGCGLVIALTSAGAPKWATALEDCKEDPAPLAPALSSDAVYVAMTNQNCFAAGTYLQTAAAPWPGKDTNKNVSDVQAGELVLMRLQP